LPDRGVQHADLAGAVLGPSSWLEVGQERIDAFADATSDHHWIHVDPARAAGGPFGETIAHGFLTLSLLIPLLAEVLPPTAGTLINYGVDRARFPAPLPSGSRIRGRFRVASVEEHARGTLLRLEATIEGEGTEKPVCVADLVLLLLA
jgi:acyl dehydratase